MNNLNSKKKNFPYIVVDSSFILWGALDHRGFNRQGFIENCIKLKKLKRKGLRIINPIREEIVKLLAENRSPEICRCLDDIGSLREWNESNLSEEYFLDLFRKNVSDIGKNGSRLSGRAPLSLRDVEYCAYTLLKSREADIIAATADKLIIDSLAYSFSLIYPLRKSLSWPETNIVFARNYDELEFQVSLSGTMAKLSLVHEHYISHLYKLDHYRHISREIWQGKTGISD